MAGENVSLFDSSREAARQRMAHGLGWEELAEADDAGRASDAAVRVVLEHLRDEFEKEASFHRHLPNAERAYGWEDAARRVKALLRLALAQRFRHEPPPPALDGSAGGKIIYCEDCTEPGGDFRFSTYYGDEDETPGWGRA